MVLKHGFKKFTKFIPPKMCIFICGFSKMIWKCSNIKSSRKYISSVVGFQNWLENVQKLYILPKIYVLICGFQKWVQNVQKYIVSIFPLKWVVDILLPIFETHKWKFRNEAAKVSKTYENRTFCISKYLLPKDAFWCWKGTFGSKKGTLETENFCIIYEKSYFLHSEISVAKRYFLISKRYFWKTKRYFTCWKLL